MLWRNQYRVVNMSARSLGFTLIELLVAITILAILAAIGTPALQSLIATNRLKTTASEMHLSFILARSEAVKRNANVTVTPADASDWSQGWSVTFGSTTLSTQNRVQGLTVSTRDSAYNSKTVSSVTYTGTGRENSTDGVSFVISLTDYPSVPARCVVVDPSGRASVVKDQDTTLSDGCN